MNTLDKLRKYRDNSFYNKYSYEVSVPLDFLKGFLLSYGVSLDDKREFRRKEELPTDKEFFELMIPKFQRDNDKWNKQMQIKFVENLFTGIDSTIMLANTEKTNQGCYCNCRIIDGLQRITALLAYFNNEFSIFDKIYFSKENERFLNSIMNLKVRIYTFKNEEEMINFYIQMNENITHSRDDIKRAKDYLKNINKN